MSRRTSPPLGRHDVGRARATRTLEAVYRDRVWAATQVQEKVLGVALENPVRAVVGTLQRRAVGVHAHVDVDGGGHGGGGGGNNNNNNNNNNKGNGNGSADAKGRGQSRN